MVVFGTNQFHQVLVVYLMYVVIRQEVDLQQRHGHSCFRCRAAEPATYVPLISVAAARATWTGGSTLFWEAARTWRVAPFSAQPTRGGGPRWAGRVCQSGQGPDRVSRVRAPGRSGPAIPKFCGEVLEII